MLEHRKLTTGFSVVREEECGDGLWKGVRWTNVRESLEDEGIEFVD